VFFGLVIGLLFWLGSFWREPRQAAPQGSALLQARPTNATRTIGLALATVALAAAWPLCAPYLGRAEEGPIRLFAPPRVSGWSRESRQATPWQPHYPGAAAATLAVYRKGENRVVVYLGYYRNQRQGAELVGSQNVIAGASESPWTRIGESPRSEVLPSG